MQLHHWVFYEQVNPLVGKFCFPGLFYDQGKGKNVKKNCEPFVQHKAD